MPKIIPKKVEMIELFYDLIFVYAIAKMTAIIHHPHNGHIRLINYLQFITVTIIVLQLWLYQTTYINRYGRSTLIENVLLMANMCATIYMANSINTDWSITFVSFNTAFIAMIACVVMQFLYQYQKNNHTKKETSSFIFVLLLEIVIISLGLLLGYDKGGLYLAVFAYILCGVILPIVFIKSNLNENCTNFPHLLERFGLITIISFGEMIINIATYFEISTFSLLPLMVFASVALLFCSYVLQMDKFIDHHQPTQGLAVYYSHFGILMGLGTITVGWSFLHEHNVDRLFLVEIILLGYATFYLSLFITTIYNKQQYKFTKKNFAYYVGVFVLMASILLSIQDNDYLFILTILVSNLAFAGYAYQRFRDEYKK